MPFHFSHCPNSPRKRLAKETIIKNFSMMDDLESVFPSDTSELDFSFTSTTTDRTFASSSARSSLALSSRTLSFNERISTSTTTPTTYYAAGTDSLHHRKWDPHWSAIKAARNLSSDWRLHFRHFKVLRHIGSGDLGRVFLCQLRDCTSVNFALKVIDRDKMSKKKLANVQTEAQILSILDHPFLPTLYAHLEASHYTCLLIDYCPKGDLHSLLYKQPGYRLPLQAVKFYAVEVLVALEYLHANGIVYRDLKPENILIREDGHIMLSDFDLCFKADVYPVFRTLHRAMGATRRPRNEEVVAEFVAEPTGAFSSSCVGTHEYLAPEVLSGNGYGNGVDWWAFGVLIYELLLGTTPFKGGTKENTLRNIASSRRVSFPGGTEGENSNKWLKDAKDLITKLLEKDPRRRLGCLKGATDIKHHRFFDGINWALIRNYEPPVVNGDGVVVAWKGRSHVSHVVRISSKRRQGYWWWRWRGLRCVLKSRGSCRSSNCNYFRYKVRKNVKGLN